MPHKFKRSQSDFRRKPPTNMIPSHEIKSWLVLYSTKRTMQTVIELTLPLQTAASLSLSFMKKCCCVCRRWLDERNWRALFTLTGHRDKHPDRLSALAGVPINRYTVLSGSTLVFVTVIVSWSDVWNVACPTVARVWWRVQQQQI